MSSLSFPSSAGTPSSAGSSLHTSSSAQTLAPLSSTNKLHTSASHHTSLSSSAQVSVGTLLNKPTTIEYKNLRFLIMDAPTDNNLSSYVEILKKKHVVAVVRACEPSYKTEQLTQNKIRVVELSFQDGDPPPSDIVDKWLDLVQKTFHDEKDASDNKSTIAVHCVAGLGRAPVLVSIALIEAGMDPYDAIKFIRKRRRGAINARQLNYIEAYKPRREAKGKGCIVM